MIEKLLNIIYPPKCGICGKINKEYLCGKCLQILKSEAIFEIKENQNPYIYFDELISIFQYKNNIRKEIIKYKFNEKTYLYKTFVKFIIKNEKIYKKIKTYDTIIPVPISKKRKKERGYNQSYLIAKELCKNTKLKLETKCLYKIKNTIEQSKLNKEERQINAQNVYKLENKKNLENKNILLLDDIYTTGNTVNECSKILRQANPKKIGIIAIAKD